MPGSRLVMSILPDELDSVKKLFTIGECAPVGNTKDRCVVLLSSCACCRKTHVLRLLLLARRRGVFALEWSHVVVGGRRRVRAGKVSV